MTDPAFLSIARLSAGMESGALDPVAVTQGFLDRAERIGRPLNVYVRLDAARALADATAAAARARAGRRIGPLDGIPIAIKDNIDVAGLPTSNGFGGRFEPVTADAEVIRRLRAAGAVILGKLNMHEGALGATNDNLHLGRAVNPHAPDHTPGGSSGGSGAAVAAGLCAAALGTDTGGSVRIPAAYCGVVGLKASYGLVSTRGVVPLSYRLDHVGPLTRTVADAALMLAAMAGPDPSSPESRPGPSQRHALPPTADLGGLRLGVVSNYADEKPDADVTQAFEVALRCLTGLGAAVQTVEMAGYDMARGRRAGFVRVEVEAAFVHAALYGTEPERFSPEMRGYLDYGLRASAQQLLQADRRIDLARHALERCFETVDAIVTPTAPQASFRFGSRIPDNQGGFTIPANFAGCPAISLPMGRTADGMPLGLQVMAPVHREDLVLRVAAAYEAAAGWQILPPPPYGPAS